MVNTGQAIVSVQRPNGIGSLTYVFHTPRYTSDLIGKFDGFNFAALSAILGDLVRGKTDATSPGLVNVSSRAGINILVCQLSSLDSLADGTSYSQYDWSRR